jgi:hypothetical protein
MTAITVYKNLQEFSTLDYSLAMLNYPSELEEQLKDHCASIGADPSEVAIVADNYTVKLITDTITLAEVASKIWNLTKPKKQNSFANGFDCFCPECERFFSIKIEPDINGGAEFCPVCGEDDLIKNTKELLLFLEEKDTDPVNFYKAFPPDEPIPLSRTGATPLQVEIIFSMVVEKKRNKLPCTVESIAGDNERFRDIVQKVFEELHITETGGAQ